ncbi:hypothetical protein [Prevotella sp. P6B1]|uniref:hypothetical protein n=1 Tax=Prevotella sp. P6B1 TaxID=1410613 RepID=UPI00051BB697|nr:hypothetical protein [Prevotella sp. P6B1]
MFWDYTAREGNGLRTDFKLSKEEEKALIAKYSYSTFDEAYKNLPVLPDPSEVDTREKMTRYTTSVVGPLCSGVENMNTDIVLYNEAADYDRGSWLLENRPAIQQEVA